MLTISSDKSIAACLGLPGYFFLLLLLSACIPLDLQAAEVPSIHYTIKDGLPSNTIYDIYQDKEGYIWFATNKGLSKYNGLTFQNYTTNNGLSDNDCLSFTADFYGRLWVCTYNGTLMYYQAGVFHTQANTPFLRLPFKDGMTQAILTQKDSSLIIFFQKRSFFLNIQKEKADFFSLTDIHKHSAAKALSYIRKPGPHTYELLYWQTSEFVTTDHRSNIFRIKKCCSSYLICPHTEGKENNDYFLCGRDFYSINNQAYKASLPQQVSDKHHIQRVHFDESIQAISTSYGLFVNNRLFFPGKDIASFLKDKDGNYWVSTLNEGIYKISASFLNTAFTPNNYKSTVVYAAMTNQQLIFGTRNRNIYRMNLDYTNPLFNYPSNDTNHKYYGHLFDGTYYFNIGDADHTHKHFNFIFSHLDTKIQRKELDKRINLEYRVTSMASHRPYLYFITNRRILQVASYKDWLSADKQNIQHQIYPGHNRTELIYHSTQAPDSNLWFSTIDHIYQVKDTTANIQDQFKDISFRQFIINKHYLIGYTFDNKLMICNRYTAKNIIIDSVKDNSCLWDKFYSVNDSVIIATTDNYYRLIQTYTSADKPRYSISIPENQFLPQSAEYIFSNGKDCYFFKEQSTTRLPVSDLFRIPAAPALSFSTIITADSTLINIDSVVTLFYQQAQNITIGFSVLSFNTPNLKYEYAISQKQDNNIWVESNNESINLYKLGSGEYTVNIRAKTPAGTYSPVCSFVLIIKRPFWLSWWFLLIDIGIAAGFTWLLIRYYTRKATARKEEELQQKEQEMKFLKSEYKALNALMNPHFIFNTLNSVQSLINKDDKQASSEHIRTVADLIRQNMHNVARDQITLEEELTLVINYLKLEQLRFSWLHFELQIDDAIDTDDIMVPPLILQPLVENAILHGLWPARLQQGIINIQVIKKEKSIVIEIRDNGKGFSNTANKDRNPNHKSTAVNNISSRMQQLSAMHGKSYTFHIEELKNDGTVSGVQATIEIEI